jgi:hypothetical protein
MTFCHQAALMTNSCDPTIETCDNKGQVLEKKITIVKVFSTFWQNQQRRQMAIQILLWPFPAVTTQFYKY